MVVAADTGQLGARIIKDLELWGGPECTLNRLDSGYHDQFAASGHYDRPADLDLFADLGLDAIRYPVLWERVAPDNPCQCDWTWPDRQLDGLRARGVRVIAGLVHHGSGPRYTDLLEPGFATGLADFAGRVAARYDWITDWTPVNEPLTTARFSGLYGHWYPHHRSEGSFWLALVNQIDGVRLAMHAVRRINRNARLIQTDDLGRTYATATMRDQAAFDNVRRWMSWDLLCGRVTPAHPFWNRLVGFGLEDRLRAIADDPCPPSIVGLNHYLTSDRFLDERTARYPAHVAGHNDAGAYADVEAARVLQPAPPGLGGAIREAWRRYGIPIAITEVHNGSTRDEQLRWMAAAWDTATRLRGDGIPVEAVTAWSLLGSHGWNTLLQGGGGYEAGVYDLGGGGRPRATAVVPLLRGLAAGGERHPVVAGAGWWRRPIRLVHPPVPRPAPMREHDAAAGRAFGTSASPLLIRGASDALAQAFARACQHRDIPYVLGSALALGVDGVGGIAAELDRHAPWAVVDVTGWARADEAEAIAFAGACAARSIPTVRLSTDRVFEGRGEGRYVEDDLPAPLGEYARSMAALESGIAALPGRHLVFRTGPLFHADDPVGLTMRVVRTLRDGRPFEVHGDRIVSPAYVPELVDRVLDLAIDGETGIWHLAHAEALPLVEFARRIAAACGLDPNQVVLVRPPDLAHVAPEAGSVRLGSRKGRGLGPLDAAIGHFTDQLVLRPGNDRVNARADDVSDAA